MMYSGKVVSDRIYQIKFGISGKLSSVNVTLGQTVNKGALLARLEQTEFQTLLDRALRNYEQVRADFDEKQKTNLSEFDKKKIQAELEISVKNTEIAKLNLEATNLYSPLAGKVIALDAGLPGMNITPASFVVTIVDPASYYLEITLKDEDLLKVKLGAEVKVTLKAFGNKVFKGKIGFISEVANKEGFWAKVILEDLKEIRLGMVGEVEVK